MSRPSLPSQSSGGSMSSSSGQDDVRAHIVASLFSRYDETGTAEETLISFVKVHERDDVGTPGPQTGGGGGEKTRYLMLAVTKLGKVVLHKAKRNSNLTFSKGKTWALEDVRAVEVVNPLEFALTMTVRRYQWSTEKPKEQQHFVNSIVKVYKTYTKGKTPELIGFVVSDRTPTTPHTTDPNDPRRPSSSSATAPNMDLRPPSFKNARSGSSSSMASAQSGTSYMSDTARRWAPPGEQTPRQETFNRGSGDQGVPPGRSSFERRPSAVSAAMQPNTSGSGGSRPSSGRNTPGTGSGPLGLGNPPPPSRKDDTRKASEASIYPEAMARGGSRDGRELPPIVTTPAIPEQRPARPARAAGRNVSTATVQSQLGTPVQAPSITTTQASPAQPDMEVLAVPDTNGSALSLSPTSPTSGPPPDHRPRRRASFHPPPLETAFTREVLLTSRTTQLPGAAGMTVDEDGRKDAIMTSVEEMLEGFDWTAPAAAGADGVQKRGADAIEARLMDELAALDSANIHAFLESDDRIAQVLGHIDEALLELDEIDAQITGYRMQLNAVTDDISFIESQNRGLQVQTSNQKALLDELRQLLQIAEVPPEDLRVLVHESPSSAKGVQVLERAAASLYKALQAGMDSANAEVQASIHRLREYQDASAQFCKRLIDYLEITFQHQSDQALSNFRKVKRSSNGGMLQPHTSMGEFLMMYEGLVLYVKEMDEVRYQRLCSNYFSTISALHQNEMKDMLMSLMSAVNASQSGEPNEASFASAISAVPKTGALAKSRAAIGLAKEKEVAVKEKRGTDTSTKVGELYQSALTGMINQIITEEDFINAFLHLSDTESTFADHMELDSYFRRQAARHATGGMSKGMVQLVRSMLDLVFGFLPQEFGQWCEAAVDRNPVAIISAIAVTERLAREAEEENTSIFFAQLFERLLAKQNGMLDRFINEQVKIIDNAKTNIRKRKGVAFFIRHFPTFVERVEAHLEGADDLPVRGKVDAGYEKVVNAVFSSVSQIAKMDRAEGQAAEDKGQLNYHIIIIENMHHFVEDMKPLGVPSLAVYTERARGLYDENMASYVKLMLRRSFGRMMIVGPNEADSQDFFDGIERQLQSTPANEVSLHSSYSKSALKKMLKDYSAKDMRKAVDTISKRVDKHLIDETDQAALADPALNALITAVWRAVTQGLKDEVSRDEGYIKACYADSGVGLEFGAGDVDGVCKRARQ